MLFSLNRGGILSSIRFGEDWHFYLAYVGFALLVIFGSYLLGSINSSIIISKVLYRDDIRKHGSGNAGMTNMLRTYGKGAAGLTLIGDMMKTALAILLAGLLFGFNYIGGVSVGEGYCYVAGLFAVLGHIFPVYYGFKGGKGVLVTSTMALVVSPIIFSVLLLVFIATVWMSKYISLGSVTVAVLYPVMVNAYSTVFLKAPPFASTVFITIFLAIFIVWLHRENLGRIGNRTERKFSFKKKAEVEIKKPVIEDEDDDEE